MALLEPQKAQQQNSIAFNKDNKTDDITGKSEEFQAFGDYGLTFWDFLDIINPLQHIPVISTLYRSITGDEIDPAAKIAGGALYGGPIGAIASLIGVAVEHGTGKDIGEHALAMVRDEPAAIETAANSASKTRAASASNPYLARATASTAPNQTSSFAPSNLMSNSVLAQEFGAEAKTTPKMAQRVGNHAGMSGIPIARKSYADQIAAYMPHRQPAAAAPDLGLMTDIKHLEKAGIIAPQTSLTTSNKPLDLSPRYDVEAANNSSLEAQNTHQRIKKAEAAYQKVSSAADNCLVNSIFDGMDKLGKTDGLTGSTSELLGEGVQ